MEAEAPRGHDPTGNEPRGCDPTGNKPIGHERIGDEPESLRVILNGACAAPSRRRPIGDEPISHEPKGDDPIGCEPKGDDWKPRLPEVTIRQATNR